MLVCVYVCMCVCMCVCVCVHVRACVCVYERMNVERKPPITPFSLFAAGTVEAAPKRAYTLRVLTMRALACGIYYTIVPVRQSLRYRKSALGPRESRQ